MLVNLTLGNFAAGKPSVNGSVFAATASLPVSHFTVVEETSIQTVSSVSTAYCVQPACNFSTQRCYIVLFRLHADLQREQKVS